jgi:hypothetical protein
MPAPDFRPSDGPLFDNGVDDEPGYETVRVHEDRLLEGAFVVFLKWAANHSLEFDLTST